MKNSNQPSLHGFMSTLMIQDGVLMTRAQAVNRLRAEGHPEWAIDSAVFGAFATMFHPDEIEAIKQFEREKAQA
jgi:hypothetical protein